MKELENSISNYYKELEKEKERIIEKAFYKKFGIHPLDEYGQITRITRKILERYECILVNEKTTLENYTITYSFDDIKFIKKGK